LNILFFTIKFRLDPRSPYLTNELCSGFLELGHTVTVINLDWHEDNKDSVVSLTEGLQVVSVLPVRFNGLPRIVNRALSWSLTSLRAYSRARKYLRHERFDAVIMTTPLTIFTLFLLAARSRIRCQRIALCWDVFPIHDLQIGALPKLLVPAIKKWEERLYNSCTKIFVLSEDYRRFLLKHFTIAETVQMACSGLWGGALQSCPDPDPELLPQGGRKVIVFGGQFVAGRGMENFLMLCRLSAQVDPQIKVLVLSSGELLRGFLDLARDENITNLVSMEPLPRAEYAKMIGHCMAGFISLEAGTGCPSFPSKIVDYARAGLPVLAVDNSNPGFRDFIESRGIGCYIPSGDAKALEAALSLLAGDADARRRMSENSRRVFHEEFDARRVASLIAPRSAPEPSGA